MKISKWWKVILFITVLIGGIGIFFSLNGDVKERDQKKDLEISIAKMLVNDYEGVKKIEFKGWGHSFETGMWGTTVVINDDNRLSLSFNDITGLESISGSSYHPETFKLIEKPGLEDLEPVKYRVNDINRVSLVGVKIIHSDESTE